MVLNSKLDFWSSEGPIHSEDIVPIATMKDELIPYVVQIIL